MEVSYVYNDYPLGGGSRNPFIIEITDSCESGLTVTSPSSISNRFYTIGSGAVTDTHDAFTPSNSICAITYSHTITPPLPTSDSSAIQYDSVLRTVTYDSVITESAGQYTIIILADY